MSDAAPIAFGLHYSAEVITGELKQKVDRVWDAFWSGGISNPLEVIEQITYLILIRCLDDLQTAKENKAARTRKPIEAPIYTDDEAALRWSSFKNIDPERMLMVVRDGVFPWLRNLGGEGSTYATHMQNALFAIPTPGLLRKVVDLIDEIPLSQQDTQGDIYEYMLGKIVAYGQVGQFRTPRHIVGLMVEMMAPGPNDEVCDPACGTAGFLTEAARFVRSHHADAQFDLTEGQHVSNTMFHGFDFDRTMLQIASMNMLLHGVEQQDIRYRDSLAENVAGEAGRYTLILANPPFAGRMDYETTAKDLQAIVKTKATELLFLALFLRLLKLGGRAAVIVPEGVLFGSSKAYKDMRKLLVDGHKLEAVIKLPTSVFKPYAGVSTAILIFTKTDSGGTDSVWFYEVTADGFSLDSRRRPLLPDDRLGSTPVSTLTETDHDKNNLPDVLVRWARRNGSERKRTRSDQSFCVSREEIRSAEYDLSIGRYKKIIHESSELAKTGESDVPAGIAGSTGAPLGVGPVIIPKLRWSAIDDEGFERLLYSIVANADGYVNPQLLMHTNAPDRGRDLSVERVIMDVLSGVSRQRLIIQAKHWLAKSVRPEDVSTAVAKVELWGPPLVDILIMATTGWFTADAVAWVEKYNALGKRPAIEMWPGSRLELILARMPYLVEQFNLRPLFEIMPARARGGPDFYLFSAHLERYSKPVI